MLFRSRIKLHYYITMHLRVQPFRLFVVESVLLLLIVLFLLHRYFSLVRNSVDPVTPLSLSPIPMGQYSNAAVVSVGEPCAQIGTEILKKGGNSVDAAIATMLCDSVVCPDLAGFGGGFLMTVYNKTTNSSLFINAREMAPAAANYTMYTSDPTKSLKGVLAVAVPGMLRGIWVAHNSYGGGVPWALLIQPAIELCESGVTVSKRLAVKINFSKDLILNTSLREYFVNNQTGELMKQGDIYKIPMLCQTLRTVADEGGNALNAGLLTSQFVNDIQNVGGMITAQDLDNYVVHVEESFEIRLKNGYKLYSGLPPSSGIVLAYILRILDGKLPAPNAGLDAVRLVEAFKFAYGERTYLGDHIFVDTSGILEKVRSDMYMKNMQNKISDEYTSLDPKFYEAYFSTSDDHGTENVVVMDSNGNAVAVTSTINTAFGSGFVSPSTGIILNNEMNDFSIPGVTNFFGFPPSSSNFIKPYKRPMSSMCPTVVTDSNGNVVLAIAGSGGSKNTLATAYVSALVLWYNKTLKEAIEEPRLYHQLMPMQIDYEYGVLKSVVDELMNVGHRVRIMKNNEESSVNAIYRTPEGLITAMTDFRQQGNTSGY